MIWTYVAASSQYHVTATTPITDFPFTLSAWLYQATAVSGNYLLSIGGGAVSNSSITLNANGTGAAVIRQADAAQTSATSTAVSVADQWNLFVMTATASSMSIYVNGSTGSGTASHSRVPTFTRLGWMCRALSTPGTFLSGAIHVGAIGLWNIALSAADVDSMYAGLLHPRYTQTANFLRLPPISATGGTPVVSALASPINETPGVPNIFEPPFMRA